MQMEIVENLGERELIRRSQLLENAKPPALTGSSGTGGF
jgi:hypothetical protein